MWAADALFLSDSWNYNQKLLETTVTGNIGLSLLNFFWWAHKFCLFLQEWRFRRSRSSKVIDVCTNRKHVCDFLLVRNTNLGLILYRFKRRFCSFYVLLTPPYSTLILGVFPLHQIAHVGVSKRIDLSLRLKLFGREIIFKEFQPMWSRYLNVTDGRTDRRHAIS